ncbi:MAG: response regulator [Planctomycetota bacterium]|jgi:DNA-binding NarL/FixJ family response regulator
MTQADKQPAEDERIKVLLIDDHPIVRQGMTMLVTAEPDMMVCGEAESAADALRAIEQTEPDVAIVDLSLKESSGLELIKDIQIRYPRLLVLVLSMRDESFYAERVLRAGAKGYVTKEEGTDRVIEGIRKILQGEVYLSEKMASKMISRYVAGKPGRSSSPGENLTDRELEIFELIGNGVTTRDIGQKLHISVKTVESHREHIKEKLRLDNATALLKHAIQWVQSQRG